MQTHTYTPTHNFKPAAVTLAQDLACTAWANYSLLLDEVLDKDEPTREDRIALAVALQDARNAESNYRREYDAWQANGGQSEVLR